MDLRGKFAIVTGASGAIGSNLVKKLEENGIKCIKVDKDTNQGCDFTKVNNVVNLTKKISSENKAIDFLFNVAGIGIYKSIDRLKIKEWQDAMSVNVTSPYIFSKNLLKNLKLSKHSMILNIGSGMGVFPTKNRVSYCASKFALRGFSLSLAKEVKEFGVDVCLLTLGSVMTPFGTGGITKRKELEKSGKKYLKVNEVVNEIIKITKSKKRQEEYVLYPKGY